MRFCFWQGQGSPLLLGRCHRSSSSLQLPPVWGTALDNSGHFVKAPQIVSSSQLLSPKPFVRTRVLQQWGMFRYSRERRSPVSARYSHQRFSHEARKSRSVGEEPLGETKTHRRPRQESAAKVGYEAQLWKIFDALRESMDAAEYKHVVLGLIFPKYISDAFQEAHTRLEAEGDEGADPEDSSPNGTAGFVLANGSMSFNQSGEGRICKKLIDADLVDCMVAFPGQIVYSTQIPACLQCITRNRQGGQCRDGRHEVLLLDARKLGRMVGRTHRELTGAEIARIADTYHAWQGKRSTGNNGDIPGFCKSATLEQVRKHGYVLTPGRYVGAESEPEEGEPFDEEMKRLVAELRERQAKAAKLDAAIEANLQRLGFADRESSR